MGTDTKDLIKQREELAHKLNGLSGQIASTQSTCKHDWSATVYIPQYQPAYTIPCDPPGTMGVDWRGPTHVEAKTTKRWQRTCTKCQLTQTTERTKTQATSGQIAGCGGSVEVPDFPIFPIVGKDAQDEARGELNLPELRAAVDRYFETTSPEQIALDIERCRVLDDNARTMCRNCGTFYEGEECLLCRKVA